MTAYQKKLHSGVPLFDTRLVREGAVPFSQRKQVRSTNDLAPVLYRFFEDKDREHFVACLLDGQKTIIGLHIVAIGGLDYAPVEPRQVFKAAILANADSVILAHNHPTGTTEPSQEDLDITRKLERAGDILGIAVCDHIVVGDSGHTSISKVQSAAPNTRAAPIRHG